MTGVTPVPTLHLPAFLLVGGCIHECDVDILAGWGSQHIGGGV